MITSLKFLCYPALLAYEEPATGTVDTWTFYRDGQITRHEQDTTGDGFRDRVAFYVDGKLVREEQDSNGDGRPDITSYYDANERISRREEDTNMDGVIDKNDVLVSSYLDARESHFKILVIQFIQMAHSQRANQ